MTLDLLFLLWTFEDFPKCIKISFDLDSVLEQLKILLVIKITFLSTETNQTNELLAANNACFLYIVIVIVDSMNLT